MSLERGRHRKHGGLLLQVLQGACQKCQAVRQMFVELFRTCRKWPQLRHLHLSHAIRQPLSAVAGESSLLKPG